MGMYQHSHLRRGRLEGTQNVWDLPLALKRILELKNLCKLSQEVNPLPYPLSPPDCSNNMNHSTLHMADQEIFILKHQFSIGFFPLEQSIIKIKLFSHDIPIFYMKSKLPD